jgi:AraC-like DNA-binding protein
MSDFGHKANCLQHESSMRVVTSDLQEAIAAVSGVYCPHDVRVLESNRGIDAVLEALPGSRQQIVSLRYSAPVKIDAGHFENLLLLMTCVDGSAKATQGRNTVDWQKGKTLPLSPNLPSRLMFDRRFWQNSIRLDKAFVEDFCSRLLNRPIDRAIRFELAPFSQPLELAWQQAVKTVQFVQSIDPARSSATLQRLEEFLAALILESHPHNYSELLSKETTSAEPRIVREAEKLMQSAGPNISIGEIAKELRVGLRSLELGFRDARKMTPTQAHRQFRLQSARQALLHPTPSTTVTSVAITFGFAHLARFSRYYQSMFNEAPSHTLRRSKGTSLR